MRPCTIAQTYTAAADREAKIPNRMKGCEVPRHSKINVPAIPATPRRIGRSVWYEAQTYCTPPHVIPRSNAVALAMKSMPPIQSTDRNFWRSDVWATFRRTTRGTTTSPKAQNGKLM